MATRQLDGGCSTVLMVVPCWPPSARIVAAPDLGVRTTLVQACNVLGAASGLDVCFTVAGARDGAGEATMRFDGR